MEKCNGFCYGSDATGTVQQRDLKYKAGSWQIAVGKDLINKSKIIIAPGYNQTLGSEKVFTRVGPPSELDEMDYERVFKVFNPGGEFFLFMLFPFNDSYGISIKPYYHFNFNETDYAELNYAINPATAAGDEPVLLSRLTGFGFAIEFVSGKFIN